MKLIDLEFKLRMNEFEMDECKLSEPPSYHEVMFFATVEDGRNREIMVGHIDNKGVDGDTPAWSILQFH